MLARAACFQPDDVAETINAATGQAENKYTPLLNQTLGLIKDLGQDNSLLPYDGRMFEYDEVKQKVEALAAQVAERNQQETEINAKLTTYEQTKAQLYHLTGLQTSIDEIFSCKYLKVRFGRLPKDSFIKLPYYEEHSFTFREYDFDGEYYWGMYLSLIHICFNPCAHLFFCLVQKRNAAVADADAGYAPVGRVGHALHISRGFQRTDALADGRQRLPHGSGQGGQRHHRPARCAGVRICGSGHLSAVGQHHQRAELRFGQIVRWP